MAAPPLRVLSCRAALVGMARTDGVLSLYDGLGAVLARNIPNSIIKARDRG